MFEHADTVAKAGAHVSVGAAGASYTYFGLPMSDLVGLVTIVYLLLQIIASAPKAVANLRHWLSRWSK